MTRPLLYSGIRSDISADTGLLYSPSPRTSHFVSGMRSKDNSVTFNFLGSHSAMGDTKIHELCVLPISPSKNLSLQPIGTLPEPHVDKKVLASIRSAKAELERFKKNHAQDGLGIRRMEDYITALQERERAKADSALGSSHGSNSGSGNSGSDGHRRLIEKNSETPYRSPYQFMINRPIGLEAAVRASQIQLRTLKQAARDATNEHKSANTLLRTEQTTIDHLTRYNQLLKEQILSRRQILDRLENTELEDERIDADTNNETVKHNRRKDMEYRRIAWRAEREQQELKQRTLESQLKLQQRFEPKRDTKQMETETRLEVKTPMTARELRETLEQERRQRQNYRRAPPPNITTEKEPFCRHDPGADTAYDENFCRLHQWIHEGDFEPKNDHSHRQASAPTAVVIENDNSLYAVSERSIRISKPVAAAAAAAAPSEQNNTAAHETATPFLRRPNIDNNKNSDNKHTSSFTEESTIRPCQPPADALASVIHGLEDDLAISRQKLSELVNLYNDHNASLRKRVRKSLAHRMETTLAEVERKSDYLYSLHDVVVFVSREGGLSQGEVRF